jgi:thioredoxin-like negative regulator of GroEL
MKRLGVAFSTLLLLICLRVFLPAQSGPAADPAFKEQFERGGQALKDGKYKDAIDALKRANKLHNNSCGECYLLLAVAYYHAGDLGHCEESCDKALAAASDDLMRADAHNLKGTAAFYAAEADNNKKMKSAEDEFRSAIQLNPKPAVFHMSLAKALLRESKDDEAKRELEECLTHGPDDEMAREARLMLADPRRGREEFAPEFEVSTLQGERISLKQLAGRVVVMDFWATWCPPCRASVPELKDLTKKYPSEKLKLISVSADKDDSAWREFVAKKNMDWAQYRDADSKVLQAFGVHAFPTYVVIDGDGIIKERLKGMNSQESVVHRLKATLSQMPQLEGEGHK